MKTLIMLFIAVGLTGCASTQPQQDPFDVALGLASLAIMNDESSGEDAMKAFGQAMQPRAVIQQTVVQEAPKIGGAQ